MKRILLSRLCFCLPLAGWLGLVPSAQAQLTAASGAVALAGGTITTPRQITAPGTYYLTGNLVAGSCDGIDVSNVSNVTIDLNGFSLSTAAPGTSYNAGVTTSGIYAAGCSNLTVRDGQINGFAYGVRSGQGATIPSGQLLEDLNLDHNTTVGIYLQGGYNVVRRCAVTNTGGSTQSLGLNSSGVFTDGPSTSVLDCDVSQVSANASQANTYGIHFAQSSTLCLAVKNRLAGASYGIYYDQSASGKYSRNLVAANVGRAYFGGTATDASHNGIDGRIAGKTASSTTIQLFYYTSGFYDGSAPPRNPDVWCAELVPSYLTSFSPYNSNEGAYQGGTLVTPKHLLFAEHFSGASGSNTLHQGDTIVFVAADNTRYARVLTATPINVPRPDGAGPSDLCLGTLDSDLPATITPASVLVGGLPSDWLPAHFPVLFTNKNKEGRVAEVSNFQYQYIEPARASNRAPWTLQYDSNGYGPGFIGDSGSPIFVVLGNQALLWQLFHYTVGAGDYIGDSAAIINGMLPTGYALHVVEAPKPVD